MKLGSIPATASQQFDRNYLPSILYVGDLATNDVIIDRLKVVVSGTPTIDLTSKNNIKILSMITLESSVSGAAAFPESSVMLASGRISNESAIITANNPSVAAVEVGEFSMSGDGVPVVASEMSVQDKSTQTFYAEEFSFLAFDPAFLLNASVVFSSGWREDVNTDELLRIYQLLHDFNIDGGLFAGKVLIDATNIQEITITVDGGRMDVLKVVLPV